MSGPTSRNALVDALLALLNGPNGLGGMTTPRMAYTWDEAPQSGTDYVLVTLSRTFGGNRRVGNYLAPSMWRATTRAVGSVNNVIELLDRCTHALEHQSIGVDSETSTGIQFEAEDEVTEDERDKALYSGLRSWTFAF